MDHVERQCSFERDLDASVSEHAGCLEHRGSSVAALLLVVRASVVRKLDVEAVSDRRHEAASQESPVCASKRPVRVDVISDERPD